MQRSALSLEPVRIRITSFVGVDLATLLTYTAEAAVIEDIEGAQPIEANWQDATWTSAGAPDHPAVLCTVGPGSGVVLTAGKTYRGWARITGGGIRPVIEADEALEVF